MFRSVTRALATSEFCDYHTTLTHLQPKDSWSTSRQLVIMGTQKLSPQGQRLRVIILTVPIMAATSGSQLSRVAFSNLLTTQDIHISVVLYKRLVLGEPQRQLPRPGDRNTDRRIVEFGREEEPGQQQQ